MEGRSWPEQPESTRAVEADQLEANRNVGSEAELTCNIYHESKEIVIAFVAIDTDKVLTLQSTYAKTNRLFLGKL